LVALALASCAAQPAAQVDVCGHDPGLGPALLGGQLRITLTDAAGAPLKSALVSADRSSMPPLGVVPDGARVLVEGLDASGAPVAFGSTALSAGAACVCISRNDWYSYSTWQDASGAYHDGPSRHFVVRAEVPPGIVIAQPLELDHLRVQPGDTLRATVAYQNTSSQSIAVRGLAVVARPPGASHLDGLVTDFSPLAIDHLDAGQLVTVDSRRTFGAADATGDWALFARLTDALGDVHDGPEVTLAVGGSDPSPLTQRAPVALDRGVVSPPTSLHVTVSYANATAAPVMLQQLVLTVRPPGGSNAGGPFDDLSPRLGATTVGPGQTIDVGADRMFALTDDPCAGLVCTVAAGACSFAPSP
jgi:hypothetical protein